MPPDIPEKNWNQYWRDSASNKGLFEIIAKFYRRFIISPSVRHYFHKYFSDTKSHVYLHAGCGSGESDNRIGFTNARFVLMDISPVALAIARRKTVLTNVHLVCGDIFNPPFKTGCIDGLWNLGVMEHFRETEIVSIFTALSRILKPQARCLIFWPPRYGLTVIALTTFLFVAAKIRRKPLVLYPDEVSKFSTRDWADALARKASLQVLKVHFGIRDAFTYVVLILARS